MAGKISPAAQGKLNDLENLLTKVQRLHGLVENYAAAKVNPETLAPPITRAFGQIRLNFMAAGLDALAQISGAMEQAARRGSAHQTKVRILREAVGSIRFQIELEQRSIVAEETRIAEKKQEVKNEKERQGKA